MPSPNAISPSPLTARFQLSTVNSRLFCSNSFRFTQFRKNASASPLESHTFKTKDLKCPVFTHLQKKGGGPPPVKSEEEGAAKKDAETAKRRPEGFGMLRYRAAALQKGRRDFDFPTGVGTREERSSPLSLRGGTAV